MRILLIYPPFTVYNNDTATPGASIPLGLANIAAYLEENKYDVSILDTVAEDVNNIKKSKKTTRVGLSDEKILEKINYYKPDIIGVSTMFTAYAQDSHRVAALAKRYDPNIPVIFGGAHASILYSDVLKDKNVDCVVIGEGEITLLELVQKIEKKESYTNIDGIALRIDGKIVKNKPRQLISNLDILPMPARHLLPMDVYFRENQKNKDSFAMNYPSLTMVTSRGCPGNCIYCAVPGIWGRGWRPFSANRILDEIEHLYNRYEIKEIQFLDDNISVSKKRLLDICDGLIKRNIKIKWTCPNGIAIWTLDKPLLKKMKEAGCYRLTFGIESGHPDTQKFIRKNLDLERSQKVIKWANEIGLWTFSTYIIGFPYETEKQIETTFNYAIKSHSDFVVFILLMPFPNTDVTNIMLKEKLLKKSSLDPRKIGEVFSGYIGMGNKYLSVGEIRNIRNKAQNRLMMSRLFRPIIHPSTIINKIKTVDDFKYFLKIVRYYISLLLSIIRFKEIKTHRIYRAKKIGVIK